MIKLMVFRKKIKTLSKEIFKNPPDGRGHGPKCIKSKSEHHFAKPTFRVLQLCASYPGWFVHFKCPKNAPCLWFGHFSSDVKLCTCMWVQHFTLELKRPNQSQGAISKAFTWIILGIKCKVVVLKKLVFWSGVCFLIWCILDHGLCLLGGF